MNKNRAKREKEIIVAVSGGFDPPHVGHVRLFRAAKKLGDKLVVILNNDNWLKKKKGYVFMPQNERAELIRAIKYVDKVLFTKHRPNPKDMSVSKTLRLLKPDIFANGGDRTKENIPEAKVCRKTGCKMVFGVGGKKVQSSSWLIKNAKRRGNPEKP